jgi:hypothetical protein
MPNFNSSMGCIPANVVQYHQRLLRKYKAWSWKVLETFVGDGPCRNLFAIYHKNLYTTDSICKMLYIQTEF